MKYNPWLVLVLVFLAIAAGLRAGREVWAQSALGVQPGGVLSSCPAPAVKAMIFCNVSGDTANPDGAYVSINGGAYAQIQVGQTAAGVSSFNKRTGAVVPATGDYGFSQLSGQITAAQMPATTTCTFTQTVGASNTITLSSCK